MNTNKKGVIGPTVLLLLDGWGVAPDSQGNALAQANLPNFKELISKYPSTVLKTALKEGSTPKKLNIADNYTALGTGRTKTSRNDCGLFDILHKAGARWLVITETEKFAYSTYFFAGRKKIDKNNYLLLSTSTISNYALRPEMSTLKIASELINKIKRGNHDFILADLANVDIIAHSGSFPAVVKAAEEADRTLKKITKAVLDNNGTLIITSPSGNAEEAIEMKTETENRQDTRNPVPFLVIGKQFEGRTFGLTEAPGNDLSLVSPNGSLLDVLPTILKIMQLPIPTDLEGKPLIEN